MYDVNAVPIHRFCQEDPVQTFRGTAASELAAIAAVLAEDWTVVPEADGGWVGRPGARDAWEVAVRSRNLCGDLRCDICNPAAFICLRRLWASGIEHAFAAAPFFRHQAMALCRRIDRQDTGPVLELEILVDMADDLAPDIRALFQAHGTLMALDERAPAKQIEDIIRCQEQLSGQRRLAAEFIRLADAIAAHWRFAPGGDGEASHNPEED